MSSSLRRISPGGPTWRRPAGFPSARRIKWWYPTGYVPRRWINLQHNRFISLVAWDAAADQGFRILGKLQEMKDLEMLNGYSPDLEKKGPYTPGRSRTGRSGRSNSGIQNSAAQRRGGIAGYARRDRCKSAGIGSQSAGGEGLTTGRRSGSSRSGRGIGCFRPRQREQPKKPPKSICGSLSPAGGSGNPAIRSSDRFRRSRRIFGRGDTGSIFLSWPKG